MNDEPYKEVGYNYFMNSKEGNRKNYSSSQRLFEIGVLQIL